ncbi:MAG: hypothetical protein JXJ04_03305 [Spirochaetales bacterium]|nr:hypothetical protein [Spirochaetales bacterium]
MDKKLLVIIILSGYLFGAENTVLFSLDNNYLWIEFGEHYKEADGSVTLELHICYGTFPDNKSKVFLPDEVKGVYTMNEKDANGKPVFFPLKIMKENDKLFIRITSPKTNPFTVLIQGEKNYGKQRKICLGETTFFLFGSSSGNKKQIEPELSGDLPDFGIVRHLQIDIAPYYSYWRQVDTPVTIGISCDNQKLKNKRVFIVDENNEDFLNPTIKQTDESGEILYIPPDDIKLRQKGTTAYKQTVIIAKEQEENTIFISSFTLLLHRSRFKHYNFIFGVIIFFSLFVIFSVFIIIKRKRFAF